MNNLVGKIILVIGFVEIFAGLLVGLVFGSATDAYGTSTFNIKIALIWWISGFVTGMLFIGFSEVIKLLDNINNKLGNNKLSNNKSGNNSENIPVEKLSISSPILNENSETTNMVGNLRLRKNYTKEIPTSNKKVIVTYLRSNQVPFDELYSTPFENFVIILINERYYIVKVSGYKPTILTENDWTEEMKEWFESEYTNLQKDIR
jgi:hypothetical protein